MTHQHEAGARHVDRDLGAPEDRVALDELDGQTLTEPLLNQFEVAIRAYDPCLSCATHALGKMPLEVQLIDAAGELVDRLVKNSRGQIGEPETGVCSC